MMPPHAPCPSDVHSYCRMIQCSQIISDGKTAMTVPAKEILSFQKLVGLVGATSTKTTDATLIGGATTLECTGATISTSTTSNSNSSRDGSNKPQSDKNAPSPSPTVSTATTATMEISYIDDDGDRVLIGSSAELEYALEVYADQDQVLTLDVQLQVQGQKPARGQTFKTTTPEEQSMMMAALEERLTAKLTQVVTASEQRLKEMIKTTMEQATMTLLSSQREHNGTKASDEEGVEYVEEVIDDEDDAEEEEEEEVVEEREVTETVSNQADKISAPAMMASNNGENVSRILFSDAYTKLMVDIRKDKQNKTTGIDETIANPEVDPDNLSAKDILRQSVLPLLATLVGQQKDSSRKMQQKLSTIQTNLDNHESQVGTWNRTVLDNISLQTKAMKSRLAYHMDGISSRTKNMKTQNDQAWERIQKSLQKVQEATTCGREELESIRSSIQRLEHLMTSSSPAASSTETKEVTEKKIRFSDRMKDIHEQKQDTKLLYKLDDELLQLRIDIGKLLKALVNKYEGEDALDAAIEDAKKKKENEAKKMEKKVKKEKKKDCGGGVIPGGNFGSEDSVCNAIGYQEKTLQKMEKTLQKMKEDAKKENEFFNSDVEEDDSGSEGTTFGDDSSYQENHDETIEYDCSTRSNTDEAAHYDVLPCDSLILYGFSKEKGFGPVAGW